jgi:hypothetical protein
MEADVCFLCAHATPLTESSKSEIVRIGNNHSPSWLAIARVPPSCIWSSGEGMMEERNQEPMALPGEETGSADLTSVGRISEDAYSGAENTVTCSARSVDNHPSEVGAAGRAAESQAAVLGRSKTSRTRPVVGPGNYFICGEFIGLYSESNTPALSAWRLVVRKLGT